MKIRLGIALFLSGCSLSESGLMQEEVRIFPIVDASIEEYDAGSIDPPSDASVTLDVGTDAEVPSPLDAGHDAFDASPVAVDSSVDAVGVTDPDASSVASSCIPPDLSGPCYQCVNLGETCQINGCWNGYYCDTLTITCVTQATCP